jgi:hypothetical protein
VPPHPSGSPAFGAGKKIKSGSDSKHYGGNPATVFRDPVFLFGAAKAHKKHPRSRRDNARHNGRIFLRRKSPERRTLNIDYVESRELQTQLGGQSIKHDRASAVEADRHPSLFRGRQHDRRGFRAADPLGTMRSKRAQPPDQRHSIGIDHVRRIQAGQEFRMVDGLHNHVDGSKEKRAGLLSGSPGKTAPSHFLVAADGDMDPKDRSGDNMIFKLVCCIYVEASSDELRVHVNADATHQRMRKALKRYSTPMVKPWGRIPATGLLFLKTISGQN